jgi:Uma2 family endonuclease
MLQPRPARMSFDDYIVWEAAQSEKHELIDGVPVPKVTRMMAGGTGRHALIASRMIAALTNRLRGKPCLPYGSDLKVKVGPGSRYPDVTVDCSRETARAVVAQDPRVVFEVLSPANDTMAVTRLLADYQSLASLSAIVLVSQNAAHAQIFVRDSAGWRLEEVSGLEAEMALPGLDVSLPLAEVYDGVEFDPA